MIDLFSLTMGASPNVFKVIIALEEMGLPYRMQRIDIAAGEQFSPAFLAVSPNAKAPAIVDHDPADRGAPVSVFESGAIMVYLADKAGRFLAPTSQPRARSEALQWVFWQMAGMGPNLGQHTHFSVYAPEPQPYALNRFRNELNRLFRVLDLRLADRPYLAGEDYTIADMICYASTRASGRLGVEVTGDIPNFARWQASIAARPAVERAYGHEAAVAGVITLASHPDAWRTMFAQSARNLDGAAAPRPAGD